MGTTDHGAAATGELRTIALSRIDVRDGFNPRSREEEAELEQPRSGAARHRLGAGHSVYWCASPATVGADHLRGHV